MRISFNAATYLQDAIHSLLQGLAVFVQICGFCWSVGVRRCAVFVRGLITGYFFIVTEGFWLVVYFVDVGLGQIYVFVVLFVCAGVIVAGFLLES